MATITVNTDEARLIAVFRAISKLDRAELIDTPDASDAYTALGQVFELDKVEKDYDSEQIKAFILGFVGGLGASQLAAVQEAQAQAEWQAAASAYLEHGDETISGGPTGGVVAGQGVDPRYVTQTGQGG